GPSPGVPTTRSGWLSPVTLPAASAYPNWSPASVLPAPVAFWSKDQPFSRPLADPLYTYTAPACTVPPLGASPGTPMATSANPSASKSAAASADPNWSPASFAPPPSVCDSHVPVVSPPEPPGKNAIAPATLGAFSKETGPTDTSSTRVGAKQ